jgi:ribosomal protein S18 acetylase RimI-like enzyme
MARHRPPPGRVLGAAAGRSDGRSGVSSSPEVRQVEERDLKRLKDLDESIFGRLAYPYFVLRQLFDVHRGDLFLIEKGTRLLGYSFAVRSSLPALGWFLGLGVDPAVRGRGYGRILADASLDRLRGQGVERVRLSVHTENLGAVRLYNRLGFRMIETVQDYLGADEPRHIMEMDLSQDYGALLSDFGDRALDG